MNPQYVQQLMEYVEETTGNDWSFYERESFYARSSHSGHRSSFVRFHDRFVDIFHTARETEDAAYMQVAADLDRLHIIGYAMSAVWAEFHDTDGIPTGFYGSGHLRWFHGPLLGGWVTLSDQWTGDDRVLMGWIVQTAEALSADPLMVEAYEAYKHMCTVEVCKIFRKDEQGCSIPIDENVPAYREALTSLHATLKLVREQLLERIRLVCSR
jgi:hypothetical protein